MGHDVGAITRLDPTAVHAADTIATTLERRQRHADTAGRASASEVVDHAVEPMTASTALSFQVDDAHRLVVQVVERETGKVVRSFTLVMPGVEPLAEEGRAPGALLDVTV
jgi:hypothetical protein